MGHIHILDVGLVLTVGAHASLQFIHKLLVGHLRRLRLFFNLGSIAQHINIIVAIHTPLALVQSLLMLLGVSGVRLNE